MLQRLKARVHTLTWPRPSADSETGAAAVEFILVLPMMLLLVVLAIDFAEFWWTRMAVATGTFEATRAVAAGYTPAEGYALYDQLAGAGLSTVGSDGHFSLAVQPGLRSVRARADVPWNWPFGLAALLNGAPEVHLKASAFFRLEEFYPGPPGKFE